MNPAIKDVTCKKQYDILRRSMFYEPIRAENDYEETNINECRKKHN